ncbi:MAG: nitroreductase family protein [Rikenellaceae bacterium]|nr:nitroreductase family protein [Rikenellaceae bacterium]MCL2692994.1 nitroreductase family protein [Rikenellaceae bacterium]
MIKEIREHRSVRKFKTTPVAADVLDEILLAGTRASNTGNMQVYSMIVTTERALIDRLAPCHFNQPCAMQAPVQITFCADINRFGCWCEQRDAMPAYDNFLWFMFAAGDAMLASQNVALEAEAHGLGICYLGTAVYNAERIAEILGLPRGVVPVTTIVMGYPDGDLPPLTTRLPLEAVVHREVYRDYSVTDIDRLWAEREASPETAQLLAENDLPNLARIFTERRYTAEANIAVSRAYFEYIKKQGFFNQ